VSLGLLFFLPKRKLSLISPITRPSDDHHRKVYTNSLMAMLNSRQAIAAAESSLSSGALSQPPKFQLSAATDLQLGQISSMHRQWPQPYDIKRDPEVCLILAVMVLHNSFIAVDGCIGQLVLLTRKTIVVCGARYLGYLFVLVRAMLGISA
jgi:hypothetical protein